MELGSRLKEARQAKGLSQEEIESSTKIQQKYLQAMEENNFEFLPGKFYTRAFIREYASAVGLDPEEVMNEHENELPAVDERSAAVYPRSKKTDVRAAAGGGSSRSTSRILPAVITGVLVVLIAFIVYFFTQQITTTDETNPAGDGPQDEVVISGDKDGKQDDEESSGDGTSEDSGDSENGSSGEDADGPTAEVELEQEGSGDFPEHTYSVKDASDEKVKVELSGTAYLEATASENGEGIIDPIPYSEEDSPLEIDVSGKNQLYLKTGNAAVTKVTVDGEQLEFPAEVSTQKLLINFN
ncbi:helix-turn-helix domain-containing protein [Salimicrobium humidisoli]|uniref:HTH cro/C1-type domain-containing protein n=1 Tax=Salimicrobium humidisoli TaxID=2029857 RepID=A0ABX4HRV0_9BACI|nr:helix-turn-helix domain-containing protein [Salimicrobium humidisoli]PBB05924.1 hypothetical protein CKW00_06750 [Salimicrobium humidisoli]